MEIHGLEGVLAEHPFCRGMAEADVALLAGCAANRRYGPGELLFRAGEEASRTWLIRTGRIAFELHDPGQGARTLETAEDGEIVGWAWLFPDWQHHFDARTLGVVRAIELDGACLRRKCEADPRFGFELTRRILLQAHRRLERRRVQGLDLYGGRP